MERKKILKRMEELEEIAYKNREKYDDTLIHIYMDDEEADEYLKLLEKLNK